MSLVIKGIDVDHESDSDKLRRLVSLILTDHLIIILTMAMAIIVPSAASTM